ncbi:hypothetical protein IT575_03170 [bacterium]|nr:hypothetical protein [bacterium]
MTSLRDKFALWFSAAHRAAGVTVDAVRNPPPPPELAKWPDLPTNRWVSSHVSNPAAQRILEAVRPVEHHRRAIVEGATDPRELAEYRGHIRGRLQASGLASRMIEAETMLPDMADALPWPWSAWARFTRPRSIEAWARHVRRNLNWYLASDQPLRPGLSFWWIMPFFFCFPRLFDLTIDIRLALVTAFAAIGLTLHYLAGRSVSSIGSGQDKSPLPVWLIISSGAGLFYWLLGGNAFEPPDQALAPELERLLSAVSFMLFYLGLLSFSSLIIRSHNKDELWTRLPGSDAAQINAEELYLYLFGQYRDDASELSAAQESGLFEGTQGTVQKQSALTAELASLDHIDHIEDRDIDEAPDDPGQDQSDQQDQQNSSAAQAAKEHQ